MRASELGDLGEVGRGRCGHQASPLGILVMAKGWGLYAVDLFFVHFLK